MDTNKTFIFFLKKRKPLLMFFLLKYLKFSDLYKLKIVCKDAGNLCDANQSD